MEEQSKVICRLEKITKQLSNKKISSISSRLTIADLLLNLQKSKMFRSFRKQIIHTSNKLSRDRPASFDQSDERKQSDRKKDTSPKRVTLDEMYIMYHQKKDRFHGRRNAIIGSHA